MKKIYSISELNHVLQGILASNVGVIWVEGEISNLAHPASGHYYFTLKDQKAQIRCVMFRHKNRLLSTIPTNGDQVLLRGTLSLYEARGDLQMIVEHIEATGSGLLLLKKEQLKQKILQLGWLDAQHKKPLPPYPQAIGIITSATGAAIQDALSVLQRRAPSCHIIIYPTLVQGEAATESICKAIKQMNQRKECDVALLIRGGGSIEDLWAFNEEKLLEAVYLSDIPIMCGIGHDTDDTLVERVADAFAPTPSAAAELVSKEYPLLQQKLAKLLQSANRAMVQILHNKSQNSRMSLQRLQAAHPYNRIAGFYQKCDFLHASLITSIQKQVQQKQQPLHNLLYSLEHNRLLQKIYRQNQLVSHYYHQLKEYINKKTSHADFRYRQINSKLHALDPAATLKRGYSIVRNEKNRIISSISGLKEKDIIKTEFYNGNLVSEIKRITKKP